MPLSWNEIRDRAIAFSREWADGRSEDAEQVAFQFETYRTYTLFPAEPKRRKSKKAERRA